MLILRRIIPILAALLYVVSPVDVVPDFLPGLGWLDDLLVLGLVAWYLTRQRGRLPWDLFSGRPGGPWTRRPSTLYQQGMVPVGRPGSALRRDGATPGRAAAADNGRSVAKAPFILPTLYPWPDLGQ